MQPYFETELGKLYHGNCLEIMPKLKTASLLLTDPPYGKNIAKTGFVGIKGVANPRKYISGNWDETAPNEDAFKLMFDKSVNQIIFGGNYFTKFLPPKSCWLVWDKERVGDYFAACELIFTSFDIPCAKIKWRWHGMIQESKEIRVHPTQKPVGLVMWIIEKYGMDATSVLDPFIGSGTTAVACERLNRRWIGIEISEAYCEIAAKRITAERQQLKLPGGF